MLALGCVRATSQSVSPIYENKKLWWAEAERPTEPVTTNWAPLYPWPSVWAADQRKEAMLSSNSL